MLALCLIWLTPPLEAMSEPMKAEARPPIPVKHPDWTALEIRSPEDLDTFFGAYKQLCRQLQSPATEPVRQEATYEVYLLALKFRFALQEGLIKAADLRPWLRDTDANLQQFVANSGLFSVTELPLNLVEKGRRELLAGLTSPNLKTREIALQTLQRDIYLPGMQAQVVPVLMSMLNEPKLADLAFIRLDELFPASMLKHLPDLLHHPSAGIRSQAFALARRHPWRIPVSKLIPFLNDSALRMQAVEALSSYPDAEVWSELKRLFLTQADFGARARIIKVLDTRNAPDVLDFSAQILAMPEQTPLPAGFSDWDYLYPEEENNALKPKTQEELFKGYALRSYFVNIEDPLPYLKPLLHHPRLGLLLVKTMRGYGYLMDNPVGIQALRQELKNPLPLQVKAALSELLANQ